MKTNDVTAKEVAERRKAAGLTQKEASALIGITLTGWQYYEMGKRHIPEPARRLFWILTDEDPTRAVNELLKRKGKK